MMLTPTGRLTPSFTPAPRPQTHARALLFGLWGLHSMARQFSLCYNHSILFVTLWHQFLLPPWLKNAEHAGAGQRGFSRIALACSHRWLRGSQETTSKQARRRQQTHQSALFILRKGRDGEICDIDLMNGQSGGRFVSQIWVSLHKELGSPSAFFSL